MFPGSARRSRQRIVEVVGDPLPQVFSGCESRKRCISRIERSLYCLAVNATLRLLAAISLIALSVAVTSCSAQTLPRTTDQIGKTCSGVKEKDQKPSFHFSLRRRTEYGPYHPLTSRQRFRWFVTSTVGPAPLLGGGIFSAALGTALDHPKEYGPGWGGFGDRFGMRLTGISTGNAIEAAVGSFWGEDPRYFAVPDKAIRGRILNVMRQTFIARRRDGDFAPAYARYIAAAGNNFLSNTWRADSEANVHDAVIRTAESFAGRMAACAYEEFWPQVRNHFFHRNR